MSSLGLEFTQIGDENVRDDNTPRSGDSETIASHTLLATPGRHGSVSSAVHADNTGRTPIIFTNCSSITPLN
jgi:hypothetical protein